MSECESENERVKEKGSGVVRAHFRRRFRERVRVNEGVRVRE